MQRKINRAVFSMKNVEENFCLKVLNVAEIADQLAAFVDLSTLPKYLISSSKLEYTIIIIKFMPRIHGLNLLDI